MKIERVKEKVPTGGWLGPNTTNWPDLHERDKPSRERKSLGPVASAT